MSIIQFVENSLNENSNDLIKYYLNELSQTEIDKIKQIINIDLKGFNRIIDNYAIKHTIKKHGTKATEEPRGQIAIEISDFELIKICIEKGNMKDGGLTKLKNQTIVYELSLNKGIYVYIEEIRMGRKEIVLQTFYIKKPPRIK